MLHMKQPQSKQNGTGWTAWQLSIRMHTCTSMRVHINFLPILCGLFVAEIRNKSWVLEFMHENRIYQKSDRILDQIVLVFWYLRPLNVFTSILAAHGIDDFNAIRIVFHKVHGISVNFNKKVKIQLTTKR